MDLGDCFPDNVDGAVLKVFRDFFVGRDVFEIVPIVCRFNCFVAGVDWTFLDFCGLFFVAEILFNSALFAFSAFKSFMPEVDRGFLDAFRLFFMAEDGFSAAAVHFDCFFVVDF